MSLPSGSPLIPDISPLTLSRSTACSAMEPNLPKTAPVPQPSDCTQVRSSSWWINPQCLRSSFVHFISTQPLLDYLEGTKLAKPPGWSCGRGPGSRGAYYFFLSVILFFTELGPEVTPPPGLNSPMEFMRSSTLEDSSDIEDEQNARDLVRDIIKKSGGRKKFLFTFLLIIDVRIIGPHVLFMTQVSDENATCKCPGFHYGFTMPSLKNVGWYLDNKKIWEIWIEECKQRYHILGHHIANNTL